MTLPLTDAQTDHARRLAAMRPKFVGTLSNREDFCFDGKFSVEKDHCYLAEPTEDELAEIHEILKGEITKDRILPARAIISALIIMAIAVIGVVVYFKVF